MAFPRNTIKHLLYAVLGIGLLLLLCVPARAEEQISSAYTCLVHRRANADSMVIGHMEDGASVTVLEQTENFYKVDCYDMAGYIAKEQIRREVDGYYITCDPDSPETAQAQYVTSAQALSLRLEILELAAAQLGTPYVMGGTAPGGFDCSGFSSYVMKNNGFTIRRTVSQQLQDTVIIPKEDLHPGDLVFFSDGGAFATHVGIYVGDNQIIHAGNAGISYADLDFSYFKDCYLCCRRILNVDTSAAQLMPAATYRADGFLSSIR